jgi:hypothetical protein
MGSHHGWCVQLLIRFYPKNFQVGGAVWEVDATDFKDKVTSRDMQAQSTQLPRRPEDNLICQFFQHTDGGHITHLITEMFWYGPHHVLTMWGSFLGHLYTGLFGISFRSTGRMLMGGNWAFSRELSIFIQSVTDLLPESLFSGRILRNNFDVQCEESINSW